MTIMPCFHCGEQMEFIQPLSCIFQTLNDGRCCPGLWKELSESNIKLNQIHHIPPHCTAQLVQTKCKQAKNVIVHFISERPTKFTH